MGREEVVRRVYDAFNRSDRAAVEAMLTDRFRLYDPPELPGGGAHAGADAVQWLFDEFRGNFEELRLTPLEFIEAGDRFVVRFHASGRSREGGISMGEEFAHAFAFDGDKISELRAYLTLAAALEAAGLSE